MRDREKREREREERESVTRTRGRRGCRGRRYPEGTELSMPGMHKICEISVSSSPGRSLAPAAADWVVDLPPEGT